MQHSRSDIFNEAKAKFAEYLKEVQEIEERELSDKETGKISISYPDANRIKNKSGNYETMLAKAKVDTHKSVNNIIEHLADPLYKEYNNKNVYRKRMLIGFSIFFAVITAATFVLVFLFSAEGYTKNEVTVAKYLITGMFINVVGLAVIIFKYLFDDKNSLFKDMIQLVEKIIENDKKCE